MRATVDCHLLCPPFDDPLVAALVGLVILAGSLRACLALTLLFKDFAQAVVVLAVLTLAVPGALVATDAVARLRPAASSLARCEPGQSRAKAPGVSPKERTKLRVM